MKKLRNFVKLDTDNEFVQGSNVKRPKRPTTDSWYEIFPPNCCEVSAPAGTPGGNTYTIVTLTCGEDVLAELDVPSTNLVTVAAVLNATYPATGEWTGSATELILESQICPDLSISLRYANTPSTGTTTTTTTTSTTSSTTTSSTTTSSTTSTSTTTV